MMRSLYSGVTGLRSHQTRMDVIGNNISNVNTLGFKKSTTNFSDLYNQTITPSSAPAANSGGTNAKQVGLGVNVSSIVIQHTPGAAQYTGAPLDLAIAGDGFFAVRTSDGLRYTRAGNFTLSSNGSLVTPSGHFVQAYGSAWKNGDAGVAKALGLEGKKSTYYENYGFAPDAQAMVTKASGNYTFRIDPATGTIKTYVNEKEIIPPPVATISTLTADSALASPKIAFPASTGMSLTGGNMLAGAAYSISVDPANASNIIIKDAAGTQVGTKTVTLAEIQAGSFALGTIAGSDLGTINFAPNAAATAADVEKIVREAAAAQEIVRENLVINPGTYSINIAGIGTFSFENTARKVQMTEEMILKDIATIMSNASVDVVNNDGFIAGNATGDMIIDMTKYTNVSVDESGAVIGQLKEATIDPIPGTGAMAKGEKVILGYIALSKFTNPEGLEKIATNLYAITPNSGRATYQLAGTQGVGAITPSSLEMSNVDMSEEMVSMIVTQRGFQSNSRVITVTDQMLEELINLKR